MGEKKINNQTELPKDEDGRIPPYYVITPNEQGIFNYDVSPDALKQIMELSDKAKRPLGEDGFKNLDISGTGPPFLHSGSRPINRQLRLIEAVSTIPFAHMASELQ